MNRGSSLPKKPKSNEVACPRCKEPIALGAEICPHCRTEFSAEDVAKRRKEHRQNWLGGCAVLIVLVAIVSYCSGRNDDADQFDGAKSAPTLLPAPDAPPAPAPVEAGEPANTLTGPQNNAARSAAQYIDMTGFSRDGLIDQLSSDAGNGYSVPDATAAVDSLNIDWNEQAVRSAKQYLEMTGFSCKGLIDQLSSDAGSKYTKSQATHGAQQAGAC